MYRGTTPTLTIETDIDLTRARYIVVTVEDFNGNEVNVDTTSMNLKVTSSRITAKLTQAQTLTLQKGTAKIQIRAIDSLGNAIASNIMSAKIEDILKDGEIP